jgi:APA family basic amino acid/polyamine antiporter
VSTEAGKPTAGSAATDPDSDSGNTGGLKRVLGGGFAIAAGVGTIIGLGIMRNPGEIAAVIPDPFYYVLLWLVVGVFALVSTAVVTELVSVTPRSGGYYALLKRSLGPYYGFLMGWVDWLSYPATIALKSIVLAEYLALLFPELAGWKAPLALGITTVFAALQLRGVVLASRVQQVAATGMGLIVIGLALALLLAGPVDSTAASGVIAEPGLKQIGLVIAAVVFTYDGWLIPSYFGGEIRGGGKVLAQACIRGVLLVLVLYVFLNTALAVSIPLAALAGHELALSGALDLAWGPGSGTFVIIAAVLFLFAHQNINYMSAPRTLYAMAQDGFSTRRATQVGRHGNPMFAVFLTWAATAGLILAGGFEFLLNLCSLFFVVLYSALLIGVLVLRRREPELDRPHRAWGHPYTTIFCLVAWILIAIIMAVAAPQSALSAAIMTAVSIPIYLAVQNWRKKNLE